MNKTYNAGRKTRSFLSSVANGIAAGAKSIAQVPGDFVSGWKGEDLRPVAGRRKAKRSK